MVRHRGGDDALSPTTLASLIADIRWLRTTGVAALIFGCTAKGTIDEPACREMLAAAESLPCVFHRAFETLANPAAGMNTLAALGFIRVLTSGGESLPTETRVNNLASLATVANHRLQVLPGGGIRAHNAAALAHAASSRWVHSSCRSPTSEGKFCPKQFDALRAALQLRP